MNKFSIQTISISLFIALASCEAETNGNNLEDAYGNKSSEVNYTNNEDLDGNKSNGTSNSQGLDEQADGDNTKDENSAQINDTKMPNIPPREIVGLEEVEIEIDETEIDDYVFHAYDKLDAFLSKYVTYSGHVNYAAIKSNKSELNAIIKEFEDNYPDGNYSYTQKLSYWINVYNVYTIKLIVDNYPTTSITKITAKPWHKKFIKLYGKTYSLNNIENDIVRKQFNEPRVHFALNCASKSCPVLLNKAYTPAKLYGQLSSQTKRFLSDTSKNQFSDKSIKISKIFDWYGDDFKKNGTLIDFFNKYRTEQLSSPKISYMDYSWDLNK